VTPDQLANLGTQIWGRQWQTPMARHVEVTDRTVRRWASGQSPIPDDVAQKLRGMTSILPPPDSTPDEDRDDACQDAMEPMLTRMANEAEAVGWHRAEIVTAIFGLTLSDIIDHAGPEAALELLENAKAAVQASQEGK
jgi:hypothetical protein